MYLSAESYHTLRDIEHPTLYFPDTPLDRRIVSINFVAATHWRSKDHTPPEVLLLPLIAARVQHLHGNLGVVPPRQIHLRGA